MASAKQINFVPSAGGLNLPRGAGWIVSSVPTCADAGPKHGNSKRETLPLRDIARVMRVPIKRALIYCDPAKLRSPIPHFVLPDLGGEPLEGRIRAYAAEFEIWWEATRRVRSSTRAAHSLSKL